MMQQVPLKILQAGAIVPVTMETVRDLSNAARYYFDEYWDLLETVRAAIDAGDWIVDGACDPERHLSKYVKRNNEGF
jgi:hypothetical protein